MINTKLLQLMVALVACVSVISGQSANVDCASLHVNGNDTFPATTEPTNYQCSHGQNPEAPGWHLDKFDYYQYSDRCPENTFLDWELKTICAANNGNCLNPDGSPDPGPFYIFDNYQNGCCLRFANIWVQKENGQWENLGSGEHVKILVAFCDMFDDGDVAANKEKLQVSWECVPAEGVEDAVEGGKGKGKGK